MRARARARAQVSLPLTQTLTLTRRGAAAQAAVEHALRQAAERGAAHRADRRPRPGSGYGQLTWLGPTLTLTLTLTPSPNPNPNQALPSSNPVRMGKLYDAEPVSSSRVPGELLMKPEPVFHGERDDRQREEAPVYEFPMHVRLLWNSNTRTTQLLPLLVA